MAPTLAVAAPGYTTPAAPFDTGAEVLVPPCADAPDLFFSEHPGDLESAKVLCRVCPLRRECLDAAVARREPWGVWGGEILDRGRIIGFKRGPGRPRAAVAVAR